MRRIVFLSLMVACAILLQIMESFFPVFGFIPGFKIGFANLASLLVLRLWGLRSMWIVSLTRILLASLMMGTIFSVPFWLSLAGGICSLVAMSLASKCRCFSIYGISILGACFHSIGQVLVITFLYRQYFMQLFLPILLALSNVSGLINAYIAQLVCHRLEKGRIQYGKI